MSVTRDEETVLVLQGGGALGAYQQLEAAGYLPDWIAGISIGAINSAIIAGNPPQRRTERLRQFWESISSRLTGQPLAPGTQARRLFNETSSALAVAIGIPGFFLPRVPPAALLPAGSSGAISHYDTAPLRETLEELVDFDLLNSGATRLSVGVVNVTTGNFTYFDTRDMPIGPEHIMASGALPPGFPPIEIDGQFYWDGGLVSNTPLQYMLDMRPPARDVCVFQVDVFSARGQMPSNLMDADQRAKEIRFSSRTRLNTDMIDRIHKLRCAAARLCAKLPEELREDPDAQLLRRAGAEAAITIVHLIYRRIGYETQSSDYEFSRLSVDEHWKAGRDDVRHTMRQQDWRKRKRPRDGVAVFDLGREGKD